MVYVWLFIAFISMAFLVWRDTVQAARRRKEIEELRDLREDLVNTREEVQLLLEQLDKAAESAVDKFSSAVIPSFQNENKPAPKVEQAIDSSIEKTIDKTMMLPRISPEISPKHQMVYSLANLGNSEAEIAQKMNIGKGEVSLILQLKAKDEHIGQ